jgi:hypothetical protein
VPLDLPPRFVESLLSRVVFTTAVVNSPTIHLTVIEPDIYRHQRESHPERIREGIRVPPVVWELLGGDAYIPRRILSARSIE